MGQGNPCTRKDMELFYVVTTITIGDGLKTPFWYAPWLDGRKPKDIAPLIFVSSKKKNCTVGDAINSNNWVRNVRLDESFTNDHLHQYFELWLLLLDVHLDPHMPDDIHWKLTESGEYTAKSAYKMQFMGTIASAMEKTIWKNWGPPKTKFFAWLAIQNRIWTADRLERRGLPNCGLCPFCNQVTESVSHIFTQCRLMRRVWDLVIEWLGLHTLKPNT